MQWDELECVMSGCVAVAGDSLEILGGIDKLRPIPTMTSDGAHIGAKPRITKLKPFKIMKMKRKLEFYKGFDA